MGLVWPPFPLFLEGRLFFSESRSRSASLKQFPDRPQTPQVFLSGVFLRARAKLPHWNRSEDENSLRWPEKSADAGVLAVPLAQRGDEMQRTDRLDDKWQGAEE